jgi:hypothetical protein
MKQQSPKAQIVKKLRRFINHRELLMAKHGAYSNAGKYKSIERIRMYLEHYQDKPLISVCRVVLLVEAEIKNIMPGQSSKFYKGAVEKIDTLLSECRQHLKEI